MELPRTLHRHACRVALAHRCGAATWLALGSAARRDREIKPSVRAENDHAERRAHPAPTFAESRASEDRPATATNIQAGALALWGGQWCRRGRSVASVTAVSAAAAQLNGPSGAMVGPGQLPLDPPVVLLFKDPQPDLALDRSCLLSVHGAMFGPQPVLRFGQPSQIARGALDSGSNRLGRDASPMRRPL
jgi:hypothetical protein